MPERGGTEGASKESENEVQAAIVEIWRDVLGIRDVITINDEFVQLGGDSLLAMVMLMRVEQRFELRDRPTNFASGLTVASLQRRVIRSVANSAAHVDASPVPSFNQELHLRRLLSANLRRAGQCDDAVGIRFLIQGALNVEAVKYALQSILKRHQVLRTAFVPEFSVGGSKLSGWQPIERLFRGTNLSRAIRFVPQLSTSVNLSFHVEDLATVSDSRRRSVMERIEVSVVRARYDYETPDLFRAALISFGAEVHQLIIGTSIVAFDGWSRRVLQRDFTSFYESFVSGTDDQLPALETQFANYAAWERKRFSQTAMGSIASDWVRETGDIQPLQAIDLCNSGESLQTERESAVETWNVSTKICGSLNAFVLAEQTTHYSVFLAATLIGIARCANRTEIALWTPFANRTHPDAESLIGPFANFQIATFDVRPDMCVRELLVHVQSEVARARKYDSIPVPILDVWAQSCWARGPLVHPEVSCEHIVFKDVESNRTGLKIVRRAISIGADQLALRVRWCQSSGRVWADAQYRIDRVAKTDARRVLHAAADALQAMLTSRDCTIENLLGD